MAAYNVLGIDVSKDELVIFDPSVHDCLCVPNTVEGLEQVMREHAWTSSDYVIGLESTGDYSFLPMQFFVNAGFTVKLLNPIVTKKFIKATIRNKKTDKSDAQVISEVVGHGEGHTITEKELKVAKKSLLRLEQKLIAMQADLKRMHQSLSKKTDNGILLEGASKEVEDLIVSVKATAKSIWKLAQEEGSNRQEEIIASHVGCGEKLSAIISTEAGDIKRFPSAKQFKAYAGIDPRVIQSGNKDIKGKMTKRGNSMLRHGLFLAAFVASQRDPELSEYYQMKRSEGKTHTHAVCTVARKLCERIYATVTQDRLYEVRYPQLST